MSENRFSSVSLFHLTKVQVEDASASHFSTDKVTLLSIRPPELMFTKQLEPFYAYFIRDKRLKHEVVLSHLSRIPDHGLMVTPLSKFVPQLSLN